MKEIVLDPELCPEGYLGNEDKYDLCGQLILAFGGEKENLERISTVVDYHSLHELPKELLWMVNSSTEEDITLTDDSPETGILYAVSELFAVGISEPSKVLQALEIIKKHLPQCTVSIKGHDEKGVRYE